MKLLVTLDEIQKIVEDHLLSQGISLEPNSFQVVRHTEGMYDDAIQVLDGVSFELAKRKA